MYGIFTYIWLIFMVNVGRYTIPMDPLGFPKINRLSLKIDRVNTKGRPGRLVSLFVTIFQGLHPRNLT